jgi:hypothetical protein
MTAFIEFILDMIDLCNFKDRYYYVGTLTFAYPDNTAMASDLAERFHIESGFNPVTE